MNGDFLKKVLGERCVQKIVVDKTDEQIDRVTTTDESERPWQYFELTQRENLLDWIDDPRKISSIQSNLENFGCIFQTMPKLLSVLDVACYGGYFYDYITKTDFCRAEELTYLGVDINPDIIEAARMVHHDTGARFPIGDVFALTDGLGGKE